MRETKKEKLITIEDINKIKVTKQTESGLNFVYEEGVYFLCYDKKDGETKVVLRRRALSKGPQEIKELGSCEKEELKVDRRWKEGQTLGSINRVELVCSLFRSKLIGGFTYPQITETNHRLNREIRNYQERKNRVDSYTSIFKEDKRELDIKLM